MRKSTIYLFVLGLAVVVMTALAGAGLVVSAQNSNSSMTMAPTNTAAKKKPRRHKAKAAAAASEGSMSEMGMMPKKSGRCDPTQQEQTDLSGTYTGKAKHADRPAMDATLTITGNNFTMTSGTETHAGRITAVTTCGYTAVTVMMGDMTPPPPGPNPPPPNQTMSLRAKKVGDNLTLTSVPGEPQMVTFTTGGAAMKPMRKHRTHKMKAGAPPPPPMKKM